MYNHAIRFSKVLRNNIASVLQSVENIAWLQAMSKPVRSLYTEFQSLRQEYLFKVRFNGQAEYLQAILNIRFDPVNWRIHVVDAAEPEPYIYAKTGSTNYQSRPVYTSWKSHGWGYGQFAAFKRYIYRCIFTHGLAAEPTTLAPYWEFWNNRHLVLRAKRTVADDVKFVVFVDRAITYDSNSFNSVLNYYRFKGLKPAIVLYN